MSLTDSVRGPPDSNSFFSKIILTLVTIHDPIREGNRVENNVVMQMVLIQMGRDNYLVTIPQELLGKFHAYSMSFSGVTSPGTKLWIM